MNEFYAGEAALRRALHAAAEQVDPGGDGLDRIRERVRHRRPMPMPIAWVDIALTRLSLRVPDGFWVAWDWMAHEVRTVAQQFLPGPARGRPARSERAWLGWARPVAAMSTAVFIVAAVIYMAVEVPQVISPIGASQLSPRSTAPHQPKGGNSAPGQTDTQSGSSQAMVGGPTAGATNSTACAKTKPTPLKTITGVPTSPTSTPTSSSTPSPAPTSTSPTGSPSPTPTPTGTGSSSPTGLGSSPSDVSLAPADPSAGTSGGQPNTASNTTEHSASGLRKTGGARARTATVRPKTTPPPCPTSRPSPKSTVKVHPDTLGQLGLWTGGAALAPGDERARIS